MRLIVVGLALVLAGCADAPMTAPVTATRVLEISGLQPVVNVVALSPNGSLVVVGDIGDDNLIARAVPSGEERWRAHVGSPRSRRRIDGVFFSPDGSQLVTTGHEASTLEIWDAATGRPVAVLGVGPTRGVAFHPTEPLLAVAGAATIHLVELDRRRVVDSMPNAHAGDAIFGIAFSGDGRTLASVSADGSLKIWNWPALTLRSSVRLSSGLEVMSPVSLALSRDAARAALNSLHGRVYVVDTVKGRQERTFANVAQAPGHGMHGELRYSLAFMEDGDWLFAPDSHDRGLRILHVPSGRAFPVLQGDAPFYKAVALALPASAVALLRPGDEQGRGPYGLEVWRLTYPPRPP